MPNAHTATFQRGSRTASATRSAALFRESDARTFFSNITGIAARLGKEIAVKAIRQAMTIVGQQFVISETIDGTLKAVGPFQAPDPGVGETRYSFDMLGEAALTEDDSLRYLKSYEQAIEALGSHYRDAPARVAEISIKLSALHPRGDRRADEHGRYHSRRQRWRLSPRPLP